MNLNELAAVVLDSIVGLEYKHKINIINLYSDLGDLFYDTDIAVNYLNKNGVDLNPQILITAFKSNYKDDILNDYVKQGIEIYTFNSDKYPKEFIDYGFYPICLYLKGNVKLLESKNKFSMVGSRRTVPLYLSKAEEISYELSKNGITVVTGVAQGGDESVIKGAIRNKNVITVMASGFNFIESEFTRDYLRKISNGDGLIITEYPLSVPPLAFHYPVRNRIIAGLSSGVLVVSGDSKSGTRYTADYALNYGKDVFAFPYNLGVKSGELCNDLIKNGANLVTATEDIANFYSVKLKSETLENLDDDEKEILNLIKNGIIDTEDIVFKLGKKIYEITPILTSLELKGLIVKTGGNTYQSLK